MRLPARCLVVLVGPSGAGKSHWASANFRSDQIVSSDSMRALVGTSEHDQRAGTDAFAVLDLVIDRRLSRGMFTVVDTLGLDPVRRQQYVSLAHRHGVVCHAVFFETAAEVCRTRNRLRGEPVPAKVLTSQLAARDQATHDLRHEEFDAVHSVNANVKANGDANRDEVVVVPDAFVDAPPATSRQRLEPMTLRFGLQLSSFIGEGGKATFGDRLGEVVSVAEAIGFTSIWVMDHMTQIPQVGRAWEDLPESWTTLAWLAARTRSVRLGTLVTGVTLRNIAHLAKIVATADVLSGGRVVCGLGAAWWREEHHRFGWDFPPVARRYALLEDALRLLPVMWGPGAPSFAGTTVAVSEAICYPRPVQEHIPILVGGSGERRTLDLVARYADACNLFGDPVTVRHKLSVLARHCEAAERDPGDIRVTHLSTAVVARSPRELNALLARHSVRSSTPEAMAQRWSAATVQDHIGRFRQLAEAGVQTAIVALPDVETPGALETFAEVIAAFRPAATAAPTHAAPTHAAPTHAALPDTHSVPW